MRKLPSMPVGAKLISYFVRFYYSVISAGYLPLNSFLTFVYNIIDKPTGAQLSQNSAPLFGRRGALLLLGFCACGEHFVAGVSRGKLAQALRYLAQHQREVLHFSCGRVREKLGHAAAYAVHAED